MMKIYPSKVCKECELEKLLTEFYLHPKMADGRLNSCKECCKDYERKRQEAGLRTAIERRAYRKLIETRPGVRAARARRWRHRNSESVNARNREWTRRNAEKVAESARRWKRRNPEARRAHTAVGNAIRDGRLKRKPCEVCGSSKAQAHHDDYDKPLEVIWLCPKHHADRHLKEV